jgi:hypothetical protein
VLTPKLQESGSHGAGVGATVARFNPREQWRLSPTGRPALCPEAVVRPQFASDTVTPAMAGQPVGFFWRHRIIEGLRSAPRPFGLPPPSSGRRLAEV